MNIAETVASLRGASPEVIDARVAGMLRGAVDPKNSHVLDYRAKLVTALRTANLWPEEERRRKVAA